MRPFAVFDIDGTLIRWQLFHAIVHHLGREGYIDSSAHNKIRAARLRWKNREPGTEFREYETVLVETYLALLPQIHPEEHARIIDEIIAEYQDQTYLYTRRLIQKLRTEGYLLFAISGSHETAVGRIARHHGFDDSIGAIFEIKDGKFTGTVATPIHDKAAALRRLVEKHSTNYQGSYAVGDSGSDAALLELAEHPVAFNPDSSLLQSAKAKSWPIIIERKSIAYELTPRSGDYILKGDDA